MKDVDKFLFSRRGNLVFDDATDDTKKHKVRITLENENNYASLLEIVKTFNDLYILCNQESNLSAEDLNNKRQSLQELYNYFKNKLIYYDNAHHLSTDIDDNYEAFAIGFGDFYGDYTSLIIKLGENFGIDYENSNYYENNKKITLTNKEWDKISNTTYLSKKHIKK